MKQSYLVHFNNIFYNLLAGVALIMGCSIGAVTAQNTNSGNKFDQSDNQYIQTKLSNYVGVYTDPPTTVAFNDPVFKTYRVPNGPLMGNGDLAVAVGGNYTDQTFFISKSDMSQSMRGVGNLTYSFSGTAGNSANYRQEQDLYKSEVRSTIPFEGATVKMRSWTSDDGNVLVTDIWTQEGVPVDVTLKLLSYTNHSTVQAGTEKGLIWATRENNDLLGSPSQPFSSKVAMVTRVLGITPKCSTIGNNSSLALFTLPTGKTVRIITVVAGGYNATNHIADAKGKVMAFTSQKIDIQYANHLNWWKSYWSKSYININDDLLERFYYGVLYEMGCATREGAIAPGLGGAWFLDGSAAWGNRYTLDYNFEAPWWGVYSSNRPELAMPFYDVILKLIPAGKKLAKDNSTVGIWYSVNAHAWSGFTDLRTLGMKGNASMAAMSFLMHYNYTQDENFLVNKCWPLLKELAIFWEDNLVWDQTNSRWAIYHSGCREGGDDTNPITDLAYVKAIFRFLISTSSTLEGKQYGGEIIHITDEQKTKWQNYVDNLSKFPTMVFNGKTVFKEAENKTKMCLGGPGDNTDVMMGVFPGEALSMGSDPELLQIAQNTVAALNSNPAKESWYQANSIPKIYTQAVRSGYSAQIVMDRLKQLLSGTQPYNDRGDHVQLRNNQTIVSPSHGWESVGALESINSMLIQSHDNIIRVFPVWVKNKDAWFKDLRASGAFLVSSEFSQGQVKFIDIKSEKGKLCNVENPWDGKVPEVFEIIGKQKVKVDNKFVNNLISFATKPGKQYKVL